MLAEVVSNKQNLESSFYGLRILACKQASPVFPWGAVLKSVLFVVLDLQTDFSFI
jgi:hypothetical protein